MLTPVPAARGRPKTEKLRLGTVKAEKESDRTNHVTRNEQQSSICESVVVGGRASVRKLFGPHISEGSRAGGEYKPPNLDGWANALSNNQNLHRPPNRHLRSRLAPCVCGLPEAWARPLLQFRLGLRQFRSFGGHPRPRDPLRSNRKVSLRTWVGDLVGRPLRQAHQDTDGSSTP